MDNYQQPDTVELILTISLLLFLLFGVVIPYILHIIIRNRISKLFLIDLDVRWTNKTFYNEILNFKNSSITYLYIGYKLSNHFGIKQYRQVLKKHNELLYKYREEPEIKKYTRTIKLKKLIGS